MQNKIVASHSCEANLWNSVNDVRTAFPGIPQGAARNLLRARNALPGGQFMTTNQMQGILNNVPGLPHQARLSILKNSSLPVDPHPLAGRSVMAFAPHNGSGDANILRDKILAYFPINKPGLPQPHVIFVMENVGPGLKFLEENRNHWDDAFGG